MKKASLPILALLTVIFFSCKETKKAETDKKDVPVETKESTENRSILGKWKIIAWNDAGTLLSAADKQKVMDSTVLEITSEGKWITRAEGQEESVNYAYYENTRTIMLPGDGGKLESNKVSFSGNQMTLASEKGSIVLERN